MTDCFCVLPWYSKEILARRATPCCLLDKSVDINLIKQDLLNNIQTPGCDKCWTVESAGETSRRQQENIFLKFEKAKDKWFVFIQKSFLSPTLKKAYIELINLRFERLAN
jgi:hypothetical protein